MMQDTTPPIPSLAEVRDRMENGLPLYLPTEVTLIERPVVPGYETLANVLQMALDQAQSGKGKERHANARAFDRQPIIEISRMVGLGFPTGQAQKKSQEAVGMFNRGEPDRAVAELLGAIVYLAAAITLIREQ